MFAADFDYEKVNWSNIFRQKIKVPNARLQSGKGAAIPSPTNHEGEGVREFLQEKIPQFLSSPVGREISQGVRDISSSIASGTPIIKAIRKRGRKAVKNLIGIGREREAERTEKVKRHNVKKPSQPRKSGKKMVRTTKVDRVKRSFYVSPLN